MSRGGLRSKGAVQGRRSSQRNRFPPCRYSCSVASTSIVVEEIQREGTLNLACHWFLCLALVAMKFQPQCAVVDASLGERALERDGIDDFKRSFARYAPPVSLWSAICFCAVLGWSAPVVAALDLSLGDSGLASLVYGRTNFIASPRDGVVRLFARTPRLRQQDGAVRAPIDLPQIVRDSAARRISYRYPWGVIECAYENTDDQLRIALQVTNGSDAMMEALELRIMDLTFKSIPNGRILDAGMFAMAGAWQPLHKAPHKATPREMPPVIFVDFHDGMLAFAIEGDAAAP